MIRPINDKVLIRRAPKLEKTALGVMLPNTATDQPNEGTIVAVGSGRRLPNGDVVPVQVSPGDAVVYAKYSGYEIGNSSENLFIIEEHEVIGKYGKDQNSASSFVPTEDRIVVKADDTIDKTAGGIALPESMHEKQTVGVVVAAGPGAMTRAGVRLPLIVSVGSRVHYTKQSGMPIKFGGVEHVIMRESDLLGLD